MSISREMLLEINNILNKEHEFLERRKFTSLTVGAKYIIKKIVFMTTRFGKAVHATLYDVTSEATFETFLPKRVADTLPETTVEIMNNSNGKYTVTYLGQSPKIIVGGNARSLLTFGCLE